MKLLSVTLLLTAGALAHSGVSKIEIDGTTYPAWDARIDPFLGDVRRIEWSNMPASVSSMSISSQFGPVNSISSPAVACGPNAKAPALKAVARAGAKVNVQWSSIIHMHRGPILSWMGQLPSVKTPATQIKFFKVDAQTYDPSTDTWANVQAAKNGNSHSFQIPSDIKSGTYAMRTELIGLHGNNPSLQAGPVTGPEFYVHCFNIDVIGNGTATPEGVTFPGAYKPNDKRLYFSPYFGQGSGVKHDSEYSCPLYAGKHDAPIGNSPIVKETGAYTGELKPEGVRLFGPVGFALKYDALKDESVTYNKNVIDLINKAWPADKDYMDVQMNLMTQLGPNLGKAFTQYDSVKSHIQAFKKDLQK